MELSQMTPEELISHWDQKDISSTSPQQHDNVQAGDIENQDLYSNFDEKFFKSGLLLPVNNDDGSDYVIPKNIDDIVELITLNKNNWESEVNNRNKSEIVQELFNNSSPAFKFLAENANSFKSIDEMLPLIQSVKEQDDLAKLDINNENDQESIIRMTLALQGLDDNMINDEIQDLKDRDKLLIRATSLKPYLDKYAQDATEKKLQQQSEKLQEDQVFWNNYYNQMNNVLVNAKDIDGMKFSQEHKALIASALIPEQESGDIPIYSIIDSLIGNGDIETLSQIALLALDKNTYNQYSNTRTANNVAQNLQKTLRHNVKSTSIEQDNRETQNKNQNNISLGYGIFNK